MIKIPIEKAGTYYRVRVRNPRLFSRIRTQDVGRKGHLMRIAGYNSRTKKWETQSWRFHESDVSLKNGKLYPKNSTTKQTFLKITRYNSKLRKLLIVG